MDSYPRFAAPDVRIFTINMLYALFVVLSVTLVP